MDPPRAQPHPCFQNPHPKSELKPDTTFTLKYIKKNADKIPASYPYSTLSGDGIFPNNGAVLQYRAVPYFEFRGLGAPPPDIGTPGDVYIDRTPGACALFSKSEEDWTMWAGHGAVDMLAHPHFVECGSARFVWFHPEQGFEWVCARTVMRRQETLRNSKTLTSRHASLSASRALAARIIEEYLANEAQMETSSTGQNSPVARGMGHDPTPVRLHPVAERPETKQSRAGTSISTAQKQTPARRASPDTDIESDESEFSAIESELSDEMFYPTKKARRLASGVSPRATTILTPRSPTRRSHADDETAQLEKELVTLQADGELQALRGKKQELAASLAESTERACALMTRLQNEYNKCHVSPSVTPDEAKRELPDLQCRVDEGKKTLLATKMKRAEAEKQLEERVQWCNDMKARQV
ncbi:hypothetical protein C8R43DRAFT_987294 [Mycena crocata]|nr:hypothetical protein C8R43DRAFT_987294 [Mycena crocata]